MAPNQECDNNPSAVLAQVARFIHQHAREILDELGLQRGQPHVLHILWDQEGLTQTQLADRVMISPPSMSHALQRLEEAGYVQRRPDPTDDRVQRVYLTQAGRDVKGPLEEGWRQVELRAFDGFSAEERETLQRLLVRVRDNLAPGACRGPCGSSDRAAEPEMPATQPHHEQEPQ